MSSRSFSSIRDLLAPTLGSVARSTNSAATLKPIWDEMVGDSIARNATPRQFENGVLTVRVREKQWLEALLGREAELMQQLNTRLGGQSILALRFEREI